MVMGWGGQPGRVEALTSRSVWEHGPDQVYHSDLQAYGIDADDAHRLYYGVTIRQKVSTRRAGRQAAVFLLGVGGMEDRRWSK
jgi:hypothetical protein